MALAVLFESGWQSRSVSPESMKDNPAKGFLKGIPSAWDDSRAQSLSVNGRELHGKLALPKQQVVCREFDLSGSEVKELLPEAVQTKIAADDLVVDTAIPFKVFMPANGGFGVKLEGSVKEPQPH